MRGRTLAPLGLLLAYALAFGSAALGRGLPAFDDHPGQLYRLWHVVRAGWAPWRWDPGWWTGFPELQFYPPAFAYAGALLHVATLGAVSVPAAYTALVWTAYLLPGVTTYALLARQLASGWRALPGAFLALTLSLWPHLASGVEGGIHVGMAPARAGWALLPALALVLTRWQERGGRFPGLVVAPLAALVVLLHPAHAPAAATLVLAGAAAATPRLSRLGAAAGSLALAAALTAFWTLPLLARLAAARPLAWGALALDLRPLPLVLAALAALAWRARRRTGDGLVAVLPWLLAGVVAIDGAILEPLGVRWLPAARVADAAWLGVVLAAGLTVGRLLERARGWREPPLALAAVAAAALLAIPGGARDPVLSLWPRAAEWPTVAAVERGLRLRELWSTLRLAPPGRVLFVRSSVPLAFRPQWWRPHTHVLALTPLETGRGIVNGTFTHPSPVARLVYRGSAAGGPVDTLVERLDGRSLFGRPLDALDAATLDRHAAALGASVVVALDEDAGRLGFLAGDRRFERWAAPPPFLVWARREPVALPRPAARDRWEIDVAAAGAWVSVGMGYYPLWRAAMRGAPLDTRSGEHGDLEVRAPGAGTVTLTYAPGLPERLGVAVSIAGLLAWLGGGALRRA